ncbi:MAG: rhodanese-like domain-containing protein [Lentisphaeraceae bacterium]|nr:rhodanese-like domain-containing protein [Lentisphaeraceae bacterium]
MKTFLILISLFFSTFLFAEESNKIFWIDVRTTEEFDSGHLKNAIHIPYQKITNKIGSITKDKNADIRVYCKVGGRAGIAKKALEKLGYKYVTNSGGYKDLLKKQKQAK